jgi:protein associated with RNAse G/E
MQPGDTLTVKVYKADGQCYRSWQCTIEEISENHLITISPPGELVEDIRGNWVGKHALRTYYWFDKPYNLIEVFGPNGEFYEIYINVASRPAWKDGGLMFYDYELDVSLVPPHAARIQDEDEFAEAAQKFGYTQAFQQEAYEIAHQAVRLANTWEVGPAPVFGEDDHVE